MYILIIIAVMLSISGCVYGYFESKRLGITRLELEFEKLPDAFDGFEFVQISDLHFLKFGEVEEKLVRILNDLKPELIVMTGDFKWSKHTDNEKVIKVTRQFLDKISAPRGFICVKGNHDKYGFVPELRKLPLTYLQNESLKFSIDGEDIYFLGVSKSFPQRKKRGIKKIRRAKTNVPDNSFKILLAHTPDYMQSAIAENIDLVLSGDTHGGQVRLPIIGSIISKAKTNRKYTMGLVKEKGTTLYTNRGVGTRGIPLRFLCPPEVAVIKLKKKRG